MVDPKCFLAYNSFMKSSAVDLVVTGVLFLCNTVKTVKYSG
jgi:hypothetical protein